MNDFIPFFLDADPGKRFCVYHPPLGTCRGTVLFVPPFAEELNKSRRMIAMQARELSRTGFAVLMVDLYGCGDSSGDFCEARWDTWMNDLTLAAEWLVQRHDAPLAVWGLRFGTLVMLDFAREHRSIDRAILWQPVQSGEAHLTQFLRLRVASTMLSGGKTTVRELKDELASKGIFEIAGYELPLDIATNMERLKLADLGVAGRMHHWFEIAADSSGEPPPACTRVIEVWKNRGIPSDLIRIQGEPFWSTQEITDCPELIARTTGLFQEKGR